MLTEKRVLSVPKQFISFLTKKRKLHLISQISLKQKQVSYSKSDLISSIISIQPILSSSGAIQTSGKGSRVIAVSLPCRYIHSASSVVKKSDLEETRKLLKYSSVLRLLHRINQQRLLLQAQRKHHFEPVHVKTI